MIQPRRKKYQSKRNKKQAMALEIIEDLRAIMEKTKAFKKLKKKPFSINSEMRGADFVLTENAEKVLSHHNRIHFDGNGKYPVGF